jgi:ethanolamine utilization protein EutN
MKLGKVIGKVWAERKVPQLNACRLSIVQPQNNDASNAGKTIVVADPERLAGIGDQVIYVTSTDATQAFTTGRVPVDAAIVELVDSIE